MRKLSDAARHVVQPDGIVSTAWPSTRDTARLLGLGFDDWQDGAGRLTLAKRADGLYAADTIAMSIPRQVGKTYLIAAITFALCVIHPGLTVIWTAHRFKTARETFSSMRGMADRPKIKPHIERVVLGAGDEQIQFRNGSRVLFGARERGFGRGFSGVDVLVFDEGQILTEAAMDDMIPATNAAPNPLVIIVGTPPKPNDPGEVFALLRKEALEGDSSDTLYVEFSADRNADPMDREQWVKANPSYPARTPERAMLRMSKSLSPASFMREALGIWDDHAKHRAIVSMPDWAELVDVGPADDAAPTALAVDMSHERLVSIAAAWREGESTHVEEVWAGIDVNEASEWLVARAGRRIPVTIDAMSPAAAMVAALKARRVKVRTSSANDMAKACGLLLDKIGAAQITHAAQDSLTDALAGAKKRSIGTAGGWGLDRSDPDVDIAPLVAATLAIFSAESVKQHQQAVFV